MSREELEAAIREGVVGPETPLDVGRGWAPARDWAEWESVALSPEAQLRIRWDNPPIPWATALVAGLCIRIFLWDPRDWDHPEVLLRMVRNTAQIAENGEVWRLWTYGLLHIGLDHIAFNLGLILYVGLTLERLLRGRDVLVMLAASVMAGGVVSMWWNPQVTAVGISAGDFGVLGATGVLGLRWTEVMPRRSRARVGFVMVAYAAWALLNAVDADGVDNMAHFGGLCAGALLGACYRPLDDRRNDRVSLATLAVMALTAVGVLAAGPRVIPWTPLEDEGARTERPAWWEVGWVATGEMGWVSPTKEASVALVADTHADRESPRRLLDAWTDELRQLDAGATVTLDADMATVHFSNASGPRVARARVIVHGRHSATVITEAPAGDRRGPWLERAITALQVAPPQSIVDARAGADSPAWRIRMEAAKAAGDWGDDDDARRIADGAAALAPDDPSLALAIVQLARRDGWSDARDRAAAAHARHPTTRSLTVAYAELLADAGDRDAARALLDAALALAPGDLELTRARAGVDR